tara:strand:- start:272 stop:445 length:174 start_codon:yes stop_codon:yes gene_type:complete
MKTFRIEFDEITTHVGTIQANSIDEAKEIVYNNCAESLNNVEPVIGETKIQLIKEII